jgi:hypothetical protein
MFGDIMFDRLDYFPNELYNCNPEDIYKVLKKPTLIELKADVSASRQNPIFISVLMHGNETSGFEILKRFLQKHIHSLSRPLMIFIANIEATKEGLRHLETQPDYNRVCRGTELSDFKEIDMMEQIEAIVESKKPFLSIDFHNNTGTNPNYACISRLEEEHINLASMFSAIVVYFTKPQGVLSLSLSKICPSITCECGLSMSEDGINNSLVLLERCFTLDDLKQKKNLKKNLNIFHTFAKVKISQDCNVSIGNSSADISFLDNFDDMNFTKLSSSTTIALLKKPMDSIIEVTNENGENITNDIFYVKNSELKTKKQLIPSMLTPNIKIMKDDCLCYLMEGLEYEHK